ncbi:MAG TPA: periplasmic heavy metal sensor [Candidatus Binatia bacterium]|nr:periplasmic heavy metal sensor [Candidatus Binatia bacterium]
MKKIFLIVGAGLLLLSFWVVPATGQGQSPLESLVKGVSGGDSLGQLLPVLLKEIGLTPEQHQRVQHIIASHRETLQSLFKQLQAANAALANKLIVPEEVKAEDLAPQVQRITELREQLLLEGLQAVLEVRSVLTPEQRVKAVQLKGQLRALGKTTGGLLGGKSTQTTPTAPTTSDSEKEKPSPQD